MDSHPHTCPCVVCCWCCPTPFFLIPSVQKCLSCTCIWEEGLTQLFKVWKGGQNAGAVYYHFEGSAKTHPLLHTGCGQKALGAPQGTLRKNTMWYRIFPIKQGHAVFYLGNDSHVEAGKGSRISWSKHVYLKRCLVLLTAYWLKSVLDYKVILNCGRKVNVS